VTVGYVGTPLKYNCSVFGQCVAIAARCAGIKVVPPGNYGGWVTFPAAEWGTRELNAVAPPHNYQNPDGTTYTEPFNRWEISDVRKEPFKNMGDFEVRQLVKTSIWVPFETSAEAHAQALIAAMKADGRYRPVNG
jgi:hypothetical protein